jgi:glycosyltransferase involved in cell wall biosynthesis
MAEMGNNQGHEVLVVQPEPFPTVPLPTYPEIKLATTPWRMLETLRAFGPEAVHIATEGTLGSFARWWFARQKLPFTTSYHTRFPEYIRERAPVPLPWGYAFIRWFHGPAERVLVPTETMRGVLTEWNIHHNTVIWNRGVEHTIFRPRERNMDLGERPYWLYAGRIAVEKNVEAFLSLELPGTKVMVGDGPARSELEQKYPEAKWMGYKFGEELAEFYAEADVFVFPSRTDTFGNVLLESIASGTPVAAFPVPGPKDVLVPGEDGVINENLQQACLDALQLDRQKVYQSSLRWTWQRCFDIFLNALAPLPRSL